MSSLTFTLIQPDLKWEDKAANLQQFQEKITSVAGVTNVVVLPEMFSTGFTMNAEQLAETMDGETVDWMRDIAVTKKLIITGSLIIKDTAPSPSERAGGEAYFNRLIWMLPNGECGTYDKRHLFAYGNEHNHYTAGTQRLIASVNGWKINLMVCYDLRFPVWCRQSPPLHAETGLVGEALEYDISIFVANWPERRNHAWKTLLAARAIENQCYVIGVNRVGYDGNNIYHSGDSMVVDPLGEVLYHKAHDEDVFTISLDKEHLQHVREKFPFWRDADRFTLLI
ncbi:MAG: amidohydrolase [Chitinophagaceae bacterium]|nr:amidohydrolase [Chitinophagaceae bacterium]